MARSIFQTLTFKSARVALFASALVAVMNAAAPYAGEAFPTQKDSILQAIGFINTVAGFFGMGGAAGAVVGRARASAPVESPSFLPGPNFGDLAKAADVVDTIGDIGRSIADIAREVDNG